MHSKDRTNYISNFPYLVKVVAFANSCKVWSATLEPLCFNYLTSLILARLVILYHIYYIFIERLKSFVLQIGKCYIF